MVAHTVDEIAGFKAAVAAEAEMRQEAWLGYEEPICGIPVTPLTLRKILYLSLARNPFLVESEETGYKHGQVLEFLWVVSAEFAPMDMKARERFIEERCGPVKISEAIASIYEYLASSFSDLSTGGETTQRAAPRIDWISATIHRMAATYSYSVDTVLDLPFRQITQLSRSQSAEDPEKYKKLSNPISDPLLDAWLTQQNTRPHA